MKHSLWQKQQCTLQLSYSQRLQNPHFSKTNWWFSFRWDFLPVLLKLASIIAENHHLIPEFQIQSKELWLKKICDHFCPICRKIHFSPFMGFSSIHS